jgi:hypothetical protein
MGELWQKMTCPGEYFYSYHCTDKLYGARNNPSTVVSLDLFLDSVYSSLLFRLCTFDLKLNDVCGEADTNPTIPLATVMFE